MKTPSKGEIWVHRNGNRYEIVSIANDPPTKDHPLHVIYQGNNGKYWSRPLWDWHRSFTTPKE